MGKDLRVKTYADWPLRTLRLRPSARAVGKCFAALVPDAAREILASIVGTIGSIGAAEIGLEDDNVREGDHGGAEPGQDLSIETDDEQTYLVVGAVRTAGRVQGKVLETRHSPMFGVVK